MEEEIIHAIHSIYPDKASGPHDFSPSFFRDYWHIIKDDIIQGVLYFFATLVMIPI